MLQVLHTSYLIHLTSYFVCGFLSAAHLNTKQYNIKLLFYKQTFQQLSADEYV
ncbi:MAG: hypothetical protein ACOVP7_00215 [Lacibacter sp.]